MGKSTLNGLFSIVMLVSGLADAHQWQVVAARTAVAGFVILAMRAAPRLRLEEIAQLVQITPITMVYGRYISTYYGL